MRIATAAVILVVTVLVAGCGGPSEPPEDVEGDTTTTFTENERGAHPNAPANDTQNETTTGAATDGGANGTATTTGNATESALRSPTGDSG